MSAMQDNTNPLERTTSDMTQLIMKPPGKPSKAAISPTREQNFPEWFQSVITDADLAENSRIRGCMVLKPNGYAIWEQIQNQFDPLLKSLGVQNCAFPLFIPLSYFQREAKHAEGFATEVAVVTHRRLEKNAAGMLVPTTPLEEPLIVRPTSEMIIGDSMSRWVQSHRDLPLKLNQWCSVVRMEMRPRMFLRTTEFWWHEGHSAHATSAEAQHHTLEMFRLYKDFVTNTLALPVIPGEKIPSERFAGAERTFSLEAMMQDKKALQAATSHYLGQNFAKAMSIQFQGSTGEREYAHTTSWGMSTRIIGALIMVHADDDGLRLPPRIAPQQVIILPIIPKEEIRSEVLEYARKVKDVLSNIIYHGRPLVVTVDERDMRGGDKNWQAIKKGIPLRIEIGPKEVASQELVLSRRDLPTGTKGTFSLDQVANGIVSLLDEQQASYYNQAKVLLDNNIRTDIKTLAELKEFFGSTGEEDSPSGGRGWVRAKWCDDESTLTILKDLKLTVRCIPLDSDTSVGTCILTNRPATTEILIAKAY